MNITVSRAAACLGHLGKGIKHNLTAAQRQDLRNRLALVRYRGGRKPGTKNKPKGEI